MEHRVKILAEVPTREHAYSGGPRDVWTIGEHGDFEFLMPETGVGALQVNLDWAAPDDLDVVDRRRTQKADLKECAKRFK